MATEVNTDLLADSMGWGKPAGTPAPPAPAPQQASTSGIPQESLLVQSMGWEKPAPEADPYIFGPEAGNSARQAALWLATEQDQKILTDRERASSMLRSTFGEIVPPVLVDLKAAERRQEIARMDHILRDAPITSTWLVDRVMAGRSVQGAEGLAAAEKTYRQMLQETLRKPIFDVPGKTPVHDKTNPLYQYTAGGAAIVDYLQMSFPEEFKRLTGAFPADIYSGPFVGAGATMALIGALGDAGDELFTAGLRALGINAEVGQPSVGTTLGKAILKVAQSWQDPAPKDASNMELGLRSAFQSTGQMLLPMLWGARAAALGTASEKKIVNLVSGWGAAMQGGQAIAEDMGDDASATRKAIHGILDATWEFVGEKFGGTGALFDKQAWAKSFLGGLAKYGLVEGTSEVWTTFMQNLDKWLLREPDKTTEQFLAEQPDAAVQTLWSVLGMGGLQVGMVRGVGALVKRKAETDQTITAHTQFADLLAILNSPEVLTALQADPQGFADVFHQMAGDTPVFIAPEALDKALADAGLTADILPSFTAEARQVAADMAIGVEIPVHELLSSLVGTGAETALIPALRVGSPDALTLTEAKEQSTKAWEFFQAEVDRAMSEIEQTDAFKGEIAEIETKVQGQLEALQRDFINTQYAQSGAKLTGLFYATLAGRLGVTPKQLYDGYVDAAGVEHKPIRFRVLGEDTAAPTTEILDQPPKATIADFAPGRIKDVINRSDWAIVTAENPQGKALTPEENADRQAALKAELDKRGIQYEQIEGKYVAEGEEETAPLEHPFLLLGTALETAQELGKMFDQDSILTRLGLVYGDNTVERALGVDEHETEPANYWSRIPSTGAMFTVNPDFGNRVPLEQLARRRAEGGELAQTTGGVTDTPEFKAWFKGSNVVDANGQPLVVYHGTTAEEDFSDFHVDRDMGAHFGTLGQAERAIGVSPSVVKDAMRYGPGAYQARRRIIPAFLRIKNPVRIPDPGAWSGDTVLAYLRQANALTEAEEAALRADYEEFMARIRENPDKRATAFEAARKEENDAFLVRVAKVLQDKGYDGLVYKNEFEHKARKRDSWVVFSSTQIKSAIGNVGTFDPNDPNILNQTGRPNSISLTGVHFSPTARDTLDGRFYGTGIPGAERKRAASAADTRLRERLHFYVSTGQGVFPETGTGTVAHAVALTNLYDADVDALGLFNGDSDVALDAAESGVLDAGYDGYLVRAFGDRQGAAVVLGEASHAIIPLAVGTGEEIRGYATVAPAADYSSAQRLAQALMAHRRKLPAGQLDATGWRKQLAAVVPELLPQIEASGALNRLQGPAYLDQVARGIYRVPAGELQQGAPKLGSFNPATYDLRILAEGNPSTFFHELSHFFLAAYADIAIQPGTPQDFVDEVNALLTHLGVTAGAVGAVGPSALEQKVWHGAKRQGFDVDDVLYHWSPTPDFTQFKPFQHFGTAEAADTRYQWPASGNKTFAELEARKTKGINGLPAEGAVFPVVIKKTKVLDLGEDTGQHDAFNLAFSIGKKLKDNTIADRLITRAVRAMTDDQVRAWAETEEMDYLFEEGEDMSVDSMRRLIEMEYLDRQGSRRTTDGGMVYVETLVANTDQEQALKELAHYLEMKHVTALSYINDVEDPGSVSYIVPDPRNVRSVHADFRGIGDYDMLEQAQDPGAAAAAQSALPAGATPLEVWASMTLDQQRPFHEKFAESFEEYLFTGKAPTTELQPLFRRLAKWFTDVYRSIKAFVAGHPNAKLNPELAAFMDRMLASEEAIASEQAKRAYVQLFKDATEAGMLLEEFAAYQALPHEAQQTAEEFMRARMMRDIKYIRDIRTKYIAALQKDARGKRAELLAEVRAEVAAQPIYQAIRFLKHGETTDANGDTIKVPGVAAKLNIEALKQMFPEEALGEQPDWRKLGYGAYGLLSNKGLHPDQVAEMYGFASGAQLVHELLTAPSQKAEVENLTDQRMLERYSDLATPDAIARAADEAIHNDVKARLLATELNALNAEIGSVTQITKAAKAYAAALMDGKGVRTIKPWQFAAAEVRAGKEAIAALKKGDRAAAALAKRSEILNHVATRAAYDAVSETEKIVARLRKIAAYKDDSSSAKSRDMDVVNAVRAALFEFGFGTEKAGKRAAEYLKLVRQHDPALADVLDAELADLTANAKEWDKLKLSELRSLAEGVEVMWHLAKRAKMAEVDGKMVPRKEIEQALWDRLDDIGIPDRIPGEGHAVTPGEEARMTVSTMVAALRRVEQWTEAKDGKHAGPFNQYIWSQIKDAADTYRAEKAVYLQRYRALLDNVAPTLRREKIDAPGIGYVFGEGTGGLGKAELLHALLHTGNASNKRKLLLGRGWAVDNNGVLDTRKWDAFIARMQTEGKLTKTDYDFVQGVWDLLEDMKPAAQKAHRSVFGRYFDEVTAEGFQTPFGEYRGGYVPALADPQIVGDAQLRALAEQENENLAYAYPTTPRGFTKARVEYNRPLKLDLRSLAQHIDKVLLFSHLTEPVTDVRRVLMSKQVSQALNRVDPAAMGTILTPFLNRAAKQILETNSPEFGKLARFWSGLRARAGMAAMFANVANTAQQVTGVALAAVKVRPKYLLEAFAHNTAHRTEMLEFMVGHSKYMQERMNNDVITADQAITSILLKPSVYESAENWTRKHAYFMQSAVDNFLSPAIWTGAFNQAKEEGLTDLQARRFADSTVRETQGSQLPEEVAAYESGSAFYRMFVQFTGYFNMVANLLGTEYTYILRDMGLKAGAGRALYVFIMGFMAQAMVGELIMQLFRGGPDDEDKDGEYLDDWLATVFVYGPARYATAMVPFVGQAANALVNTWNSKPYDDRMSTAPAISMIEAAVRAPNSLYKAMTDDGKPSRAAIDVGAAMSMVTGLPVRAVAKPVGYLADIEAERVEPTSMLDAIRGAVSGTASPESKQ